MNILMLTDMFLPHSGGSRVYYYQLYKYLISEFPDKVTILTTKIPGWEAFDRGASSPSLKIVRNSRPLSSLKYSELPKAIFPLVGTLGMMRSQSVDVLHCGDLYPPGAIGFLLGRFRFPYIMFCHGDDIALTDQWRYQPLVRDRIYRGANAIIAANEFAFRGLQRIGIPLERIHKITPGIDIGCFRPMPRNSELRSNLNVEGRTVLLSVGRLVPKKGHSTILKAIARVVATNPNLRYLVAGDGPERIRLEQMVRELSLNDIVTFLGDIPQERLPDLYNLCDLFVLANRVAEGDVESFGIVFLEASAVGKPVIAGRSGGTAEPVLHGQTGLLVDPDSDEELAEALRLLVVKEELRAEMGDAGLKRVHREFTWPARAAMLREINQEVLHANRRV